jgi:hypothetical protein
VGNQTDTTSCSFFQSLNIKMNTSMVSLSYSKTKFPEIKSSPRKAHRQKFVHKSLIIRRPFFLLTHQNILKWRIIWNGWLKSWSKNRSYHISKETKICTTTVSFSKYNLPVYAICYIYFEILSGFWDITICSSFILFESQWGSLKKYMHIWIECMYKVL